MHEADLRYVPLQQPAQHLCRLRRANAINPMRGEVMGDLRVASQDAHFAQRTPVHAERGQAQGVPMMRQRIEEAICSGIVRLSRRSDERAHRRKQNEMIQQELGRCNVQIPRAGDFGRHHARKPLRRKLRQESVVKHHRGMKDSAQRSQLAVNLRQHPLHLTLVRDVGLDDEHICAAPFQFRNSPFRFRSGRTASACQDQVLRPTFDHPLSYSEPEPSKSSSDQIGCLR